MRFPKRKYALTFLASSVLTAEAGLLPHSKAKGHFAFAKRGSVSPAWPSKQDSLLLLTEPPSAAAIAQAQEQNTQLARQAYANLARISGGKASDHDSDNTLSDTSEEDETMIPDILPRAARPQKSPSQAPESDVNEHDEPETAKAPAKPLPALHRAHTYAARGLGKFQYGRDPIRGVNIGGWLVLEPWITPSIFSGTGDDAVVDEYTYGQKYGSVEAARMLSPHWDNWITESDFAAIAANGLNHVRIPIGYWAIDGKEGVYPQGQYPYLFKAVDWCKKYGLKAIIDLHGAPGSQNGFDNSGRRGTANWQNDDENVNRTKAALQTLLDDFYVPEYYDTVTSIELLNEPAGFLGGKMMDVVKQFYYDSYGQVRYPASADGNTTASDLLVTMHDAFQPLESWKGFMPSPSWQNVALDTHYYSVFNENDLRMTDDQRIQAVCKARDGLVESNKNLWTMVGEWSTARDDCAASLNGTVTGRGVGSRYDGTYPGSNKIGSCDGRTGSAETFSEDFKTFLGKYWEVQTNVFEQASGWVYWAWKTEKTDEWSYSKGVEYGWIPKDPTQKKYPDPCSS